MKLTSLLPRENVLVDLKAAGREAALREMLERLRARGRLGGAPGEEVGVEEILECLLERERAGGTALGAGVAFPHARSRRFGDFLLALGTSRRGVEFEALDGKPVHFILLAVAPPEKNRLLLGVMAALSRAVSTPGLVRRLVETGDPDRVWALLEEADLQVTTNVTAAELMKRDFVSARPEMTLSQVADLMHRERLDVLPVVDEDGGLAGEVSAGLLFRASMPAYFADMPSLDFARDFDAFEHFFREGAHRRVKDLADTRPHTVAPDTPLAAVIALLARPGVLKLYVVSAGRLAGVIDSFSIIDKVLSL